MSVDEKIFANGHVAKSVLRDFAEHPDDFDDDAVEEIWQHLDECEACIEDYEAIRDGRAPQRRESAPEPPAQSAPDSGVVDTHSFDPEDLKAAKVEEAKRDDEDHIDGLMPIGDDPTRNGVPSEYSNGSRPAVVNLETEPPLESATEDASAESDSDTQEDGTHEGEQDDRPPRPETPKIDGLITGRVTHSETEADRLETESALEAGERIRRESSGKRLVLVQRDGEQQQVELEGETQPAGKDEPAEGKDDAGDEKVAAAPAAPGEREDGETPAPASAARKEHGDDHKTAGAKSARGDDREDGDSTPARPAHGKDRDGGERSAAPAAREKPVSSPTRPKPAARQPTPASKKKSEPLEEGLNKALAFVSRPRNAIFVGCAVLLIAGAIVAALVLTGGEETRLDAGWEPLDVVETRVPLQEVIIRTMRRGRIPRAFGPDVTLDFRGVDRLVIAADLDFIKGKTSPHELILRNPAGLNIFQEPIPQVYMDDGRLFLRLLPKQFEEGQTYKLELITHHADQSVMVIAESLFDIEK